MAELPAPDLPPLGDYSSYPMEPPDWHNMTVDQWQQYLDWYRTYGGGASGGGSNIAGGGGGGDGGIPPMDIPIPPPPDVNMPPMPLWYPGVNMSRAGQIGLSAIPYFSAIKAAVIAPQLLWKLGGSAGNLLKRIFPGGGAGGGGGGGGGGAGGGASGGYYDPSYLRSIGYEPGQGAGSLWPGAGPTAGPLDIGAYGVGGGGGSFFHDLAGARGGPLPGALAGLGSFSGYAGSWPGTAAIMLHSGHMQDWAKSQGYNSIGDFLRSTGFSLQGGWGAPAQGGGAGLSGSGRGMTRNYQSGGVVSPLTNNERKTEDMNYENYQTGGVVPGGGAYAGANKGGGGGIPGPTGGPLGLGGGGYGGGYYGGNPFVSFLANLFSGGGYGGYPLGGPAPGLQGGPAGGFGPATNWIPQGGGGATQPAPQRQGGPAGGTGPATGGGGALPIGQVTNPPPGGFAQPPATISSGPATVMGGGNLGGYNFGSSADQPHEGPGGRIINYGGSPLTALLGNIFRGYGGGGWFGGGPAPGLQGGPSTGWGPATNWIPHGGGWQGGGPAPARQGGPLKGYQAGGVIPFGKQPPYTGPGPAGGPLGIGGGGGGGGPMGGGLPIGQVTNPPPGGFAHPPATIGSGPASVVGGGGGGGGTVSPGPGIKPGTGGAGPAPGLQGGPSTGWGPATNWIPHGGYGFDGGNMPGPVGGPLGLGGYGGGNVPGPTGGPLGLGGGYWQPRVMGFQQGGIAGLVPMMPQGTDTVPAMLTPGEMVLNKRQQGAVKPVPGKAKQLRGDQRAAFKKQKRG